MSEVPLYTTHLRARVETAPVSVQGYLAHKKQRPPRTLL